jgi:hypothetical protein
MGAVWTPLVGYHQIPQIAACLPRPDGDAPTVQPRSATGWTRCAPRNQFGQGPGDLVSASMSGVGPGLPENS